MQEELENYTNGKINYDPNILLWIYDDIGEAIIDTFDGKLPPKMKYYLRRFDGYKDGYYIPEDDDDRSSIAIWYLCSMIDLDALEKMFGKPLFHNEYGEGFGDIYDREKGTYTSSPIEFDCASYFIELKGIKISITIDHRGTMIHPEHFKTKSAVLEAFKELIKISKDCVDMTDLKRI